MKYNQTLIDLVYTKNNKLLLLLVFIQPKASRELNVTILGEAYMFKEFVQTAEKSDEKVL